MHGRTSINRRLRRYLAALSATVVASGCAVVEQPGLDQTTARSPQPMGSNEKTPDGLQGEIMGFTDTYWGLVAQGADSCLSASKTPERRLLAHQFKLDAIENALRIATGANSIVSMLDMTVMVSLQRRVLDEYWIPQVWGDDGALLRDAFSQLEDEIWQITSRVLVQEDVDALRELIDLMSEQYSDQIYVSNLRASTFADARQRSKVVVPGGRSLLGVFRLDPLANLSPTTRQIAESRLLGERVFYYFKRMPTLVEWHADHAMLSAAAIPETGQVLSDVTSVAEAGQRAADAVEEVVSIIPTEREAAIDQAGEVLSEQREAALKQFFDGLAVEREAIFSRIEADDEELRGTLSELRGVIDASEELSTSMQTTLTVATQLADALSSDEPPDPDAEPFDPTEYQVAFESLAVASEELTRTFVSFDEMLSSDAWGERGQQFGEVAAQSRLTGEALIDRMFSRGIILAVILGGVLLVAQIVFRLIAPKLPAKRGQ